MSYSIFKINRTCKSFQLINANNEGKLIHNYNDSVTYFKQLSIFTINILRIELFLMATDDNRTI